MPSHLSDQEIKLRMTELRNLRHLHSEARKKIVRQGKQIKLLKQQVHILQEQNKKKDKIIESFSLQPEELRIKVFGKKKTKNGKPKKGKKKERESSSYQRPIPENITKEETHTIDTCDVRQTVLTKKRVRIFYVEDIPFDKPQREAVKHTVEQGYCEKCKKWRSAIPLPFGFQSIWKNVCKTRENDTNRI